MTKNNIKTLCNEYGLDYEGIFADSPVYKKLYLRFTKCDKIIMRKIYKGKPFDFIKYDGRVFYIE